MKRRLIDAAAVGGLGLLFHLLACKFWGAHRAGSVDPFQYSRGWEDIALTYTAVPMFLLGAMLGASGRCSPKSLRAILFLALVSGLLLVAVHVYTRNWALGELRDPQGSQTSTVGFMQC